MSNPCLFVIGPLSPCDCTQVRRKNLDAMRKILGRSLGMCPRTKILRGYIAIESQLGEVGRCRVLYEKWVSGWPAQVQAWVAFSELERSLAEADRAVAVFELAVSQPVLDAPEVRSWIRHSHACGPFLATSSSHARPSRLFGRPTSTLRLSVSNLLGHAHFTSAFSLDPKPPRCG